MIKCELRTQPHINRLQDTLNINGLVNLKMQTVDSLKSHHPNGQNVPGSTKKSTKICFQANESQWRQVGNHLTDKCWGKYLNTSHTWNLSEVTTVQDKLVNNKKDKIHKEIYCQENPQVKQTGRTWNCTAIWKSEINTLTRKGQKTEFRDKRLCTMKRQVWKEQYCGFLFSFSLTFSLLG